MDVVNDSDDFKVAISVTTSQSQMVFESRNNNNGLYELNIIVLHF